MWALGYHVDPSDYAKTFRVRYDRRIFTEFNTQPGARASFELGGIPLGSVNIRRPGVKLERFLSHAVRKDGSRVESDRIREAIDSPAEEAKLDSVVFRGVQIQLDDPNVIKLGQWSYNELDHADDAEMHEALIVFAWLGNFDIRRDNNRFVLDLSSGSPRWKFMVSDVGACLGRSRWRYATFTDSENPTAFGKRLTRRGKLTGYTTLEPVEAFVRTTRAEASRAVGRLMRLSRAQIVTALEVSGFTPEDVRLYTELLLRRRDELAEAYPPTAQ
jgi:hypothetical protein